MARLRNDLLCDLLFQAAKEVGFPHVVGAACVFCFHLHLFQAFIPNGQQIYTFAPSKAIFSMIGCKNKSF